MALEAEVRDYLADNPDVAALFPGGVFARGAFGRDGLPRKAITLDADNFPQPCLLVKERSVTPDGGVYDAPTQTTSAVGMVECWLYQHEGYSQIDAAMPFLFAAMQGRKFARTFGARLGFHLRRQFDPALGLCAERLDWQIERILGGE